MQVPEIANNISDTFEQDTYTVPDLQINADCYIPHDNENDSNESFESDCETSECEMINVNLRVNLTLTVACVTGLLRSTLFSLAAVTALLHILWLASFAVPKDARTLLETLKVHRFLAETITILVLKTE